MAKAAKCDLTGEVFEGEATRELDIALSEDLKVRVTIFRRETKDRFIQGDLGPAGVKAINQAIGNLKKQKAVQA